MEMKRKVSGVAGDAEVMPGPDAARSAGAKDVQNRLWREENRAALEAYAAEVAREGSPLVAFRTF